MSRPAGDVFIDDTGYSYFSTDGKYCHEPIYRHMIKLDHMIINTLTIRCRQPVHIAYCNIQHINAICMSVRFEYVNCENVWMVSDACTFNNSFIHSAVIEAIRINVVNTKISTGDIKTYCDYIGFVSITQSLTISSFTRCTSIDQSTDKIYRSTYCRNRRLLPLGMRIIFERPINVVAIRVKPYQCVYSIIKLHIHRKIIGWKG